MIVKDKYSYLGTCIHYSVKILNSNYVLNF